MGRLTGTRAGSLASLHPREESARAGSSIPAPIFIPFS
jgi:hypothetical protein